MSTDDTRPDIPLGPPKLPSTAALRSYMEATGWVERDKPGPAGSLWDKGDFWFGVPHEDDEFLILGSLARLAAAEGRAPAEVSRSIEMDAAAPAVTSPAPAPAGRPATATGPAEGNWRERAERAEAELAAVREALRAHMQSFTDPKGGGQLCGGRLRPSPCPDAALAEGAGRD